MFRRCPRSSGPNVIIAGLSVDSQTMKVAIRSIDCTDLQCNPVKSPPSQTRNMTNLKICIAQTSPRSGPEVVPESDAFGSLTQNLKTTSELVERARSEGADLVVFPEYWLQGIVQDREVSRFHPVDKWHRLTNSGALQYLVHPAPYLIEHLQYLAKQHGIAVCGTIVEPKDHTPLKEPTSSPFAHLRTNTAAESSSEWTDYIRRAYASADPTVVKESTQHVREGDAKDLPTKGTHSGGMDKSEEVDTMINVAYVFEGGTGNIVGRYVKKNLWISERCVADQGVLLRSLADGCSSETT